MEEGRGCRHCGLPIPGGARAEHREFCCFGCRFAYRLAMPSTASSPSGEPASAAASTLLLRLGASIFLTLNVMVASWLSYSQEVFGTAARAEGADAILPALFGYLALFLCTLVIVLLGLPMLSDVLRTLGRPSARTLIVLGVFAAYALSAVHTLQGEGGLYFDTAAVILVIVTLGSYLEAGAKRRAAVSATRGLATLPRQARVLVGGELCDRDSDRLRVGDLVQTRPGERVAVDATVIEGRGHVDESSLTGESRPRAVSPGERLLAGGVSLDGLLLIRAEAVGGDTVLALTERSLAEARATRPEMQRLADRIAAVFVPLVVLIAAWVLVAATRDGRFADGLLDALAVLLISCPCALGLAAPLACWHGLRRAAERGILVDSALTLERAAAVDSASFDKTGTLTEPTLTLGAVTVVPGLDASRVLSWAADLESASLHPFARAIVEHAKGQGLAVTTPESASALPGLGMEGRVAGRDLRLGGRHWAEELGMTEDPLVLESRDESFHSVFLMDDERVLGRFDLVEQLRPEAAAAIDALREMAIEVGVLSGDREDHVLPLAERLGVEAEGRLLPADKVRRLTELRGRGRRVAMVGDGVNDAPVLAAADVGIAIGSASDLASRSGNVRLLSDRLSHIPDLFGIARDVRRRILANLLGAFAFNSIGIALAAAGWLTPVFAALAMIASSVTVVWISGRAGTSFSLAGEDPAVGVDRGVDRSVDQETDHSPVTVVEPALGLER